LPDSSATLRRNPGSGFSARLAFAVPSVRAAIVGAILWGLAMTLSAQFALWLAIRLDTFHLLQLSVLFFAGGAVTWPLALFAIRFCSGGRRPETWFAASIVFLSIGTVIVTAALFALQYRIYYAQWHGGAFTKIWMYQLFFTTAAAVYQFAVMGLRLYLPFGAVILFVTAWIIARRGGKSGTGTIFPI
jgi:hypothetical protein